MESTIHEAIARHGEYLAMHDAVLQEILAYLAKERPTLIDEISASVAADHARLDQISTPDFQLRNANIQARLDSFLSGAQRLSRAATR